VYGKTPTQPLTVMQDPRVKTPALAMQQIYTLSTAAYREAAAAYDGAAKARALRDQIARLAPSATGVAATALAAFDKKVETAVGAAAAGRGGRGGAGFGAPAAAPTAGAAPTLTGAAAELSGAMNLLQAADVTPTALHLNAIAAARASGRRAMAAWTAIRTVDLPAVNAKLKAAGLAPLTLE
jgi:hypothetical protein